MGERKFGTDLRAQPDYLAYQQDVPVNTNIDGNRGPALVGKVQNALELVGEVDEDVSLADTTTLTITFLSSDTETGSYTSQYSKTITASGATVLEAGTELARYAPNSSDKLWWKVNIATTDPAAAGKVAGYIAHRGR